MKLKKLLFSLSLSAFIALSLSPVAKTYATDYASKSGSIDGSSYSLYLSGNTMALTGTTAYASSGVVRTVSIVGQYFDPDVSGTHVKTNGAGAMYGAASAPIFVGGNSRFFQASTTHSIGSWSTSLSSSIY
jgi:hypothetical protein